jgi:septum site-determining protein MinD
MGRIITVASGKGGTGKTTTVAALASCLAVLGHKTLCIDFDAELRNLDLALGMTDFTIMDFKDVVSGRKELMEACSESPLITNLFFLSAPTDSDHSEIDFEAVKKMFADIRGKFDYCLVDAPPGISSGLKLAHCSADMSIIVTTGELPAMRDATRVASTVRDLGITNLRLIVNRVIPKNFKLMKATIDDVIDTTGIQLLGLIVEDKNIPRALNEGLPLVLHDKRKSAYDFLDVARRITGEDVPLNY